MRRQRRTNRKGDVVSYYSERSNLPYYSYVWEILENLGEQGTILDVGGFDSPVATWGDFLYREVVDIRQVREEDRHENVKYTHGDFLDLNLGQFSCVTCLQVMEHLKDDQVKPFAERLLELTKLNGVLIVSVPHMWSATRCEEHYQDPINLTKFLQWFPIEPVSIRVTSLNRMVAVFGDYRYAG